MAQSSEAGVLDKSGPWTDLGLTLPIFVGYHLGVIWLPARNAADLVTRELVKLADHNLNKYIILTLGIGVAYVGTLALLGRDKAMSSLRFVAIALEAVVYAIAMRLLAGYAVERLSLARPELSPLAVLPGIVMSLGAGFYEELVFRVLLFGLGWQLLRILFPLPTFLLRGSILLVWALLSAVVFSLWHHIGDTAEPLNLHAFGFRLVCGLVFTAIYAWRGFAPVVWTHVLYDVWVLVPHGVELPDVFRHTPF